MSGAAEEIAVLQTMASAALHARWVDVTGGPVPRVSPKLLRLALAWEIQAAASTDRAHNTGRVLDQLARRAAPRQSSGAVRLTREWRGRLHVVTIGEDKAIQWDGRTWNSLSVVARAITGTRWSGPAFFGLRKKAAA